MVDTVTRRERDDLLWRHLKSLPAFRALLRAVEARFYRAINIPGPVLDLGCGDGHFASMAFDEPLAVGVDPWWRPLQKARRAGAYRLNVQALGDALPFASGCFGSVISNSVLEHIPDVQPVLDEASRVLRPEGRLVITMPSHLFTENLGGAQLLGPLGLGDSYRRFFNTISRHAHTDPPELWAERLALAGFRVLRWQYYFSTGALRTLEAGHAQGLPAAVVHFLTGHWIVAPWRSSLSPTERWVRPYYEETPPESGAYLFFLAEKVAGGPVEALLPPARPFATETLQQVDAAGRAEEAVIPPPAPAPLPAREQPRVESRPVGAARPTGQALQRVLLLLTAALALLAQLQLSRPNASPTGGVTLYVLSLLSLGSLLLLRRQMGGLELPRPSELPRQRLLYPLALLLALFAQQLGGRTLYGGRPWLALPFWGGAIAVAFYSLRWPASPVDALRWRLPGWRTLLLPGGLFLLALLPRVVALAEHPFMLNGVEASLGLDALAVADGRIGNPFATGWLTNPILPLFLQAIPLKLLGPGVVAARLLSALFGAATAPLLYFVGRRLWSEAVGITAALLLAGSHWHLHYSRLGMTNVWEPFFLLLALGLLAIARQTGTRSAWLWGGLALGANAYLYTPSHLLPFLLAALLVYVALFDRRTLAAQGRHMLAALALAAVVALPIWRYYALNPGLYMERAGTLGILQNGWLAQEAAQTGESLVELAGRQLSQAALAFNATVDRSSHYNPGVALLRFWPALFFVLGSGVALIRLRQFRYALLLIWVAVTVIFAGALLLDPPASHRLLVAAPAVFLLAALGLVEMLLLVLGLLERRPNARTMVQALAVLALLFAAADLAFYFGPYRATHRFGDRNTEIAYRMALYMQTLPEESVVYFHGPPVMYVDFPTLSFLAQGYQPDVNLFNVDDPAAPLPVEEGLLTFVYVPERSGELESTRERLPGGHVRSFDGFLADPLFYSYEVRP